MTTAVIGARAEALAQELGGPARAASAGEAIRSADAVVLAVWLDTIRHLVAEHAGLMPAGARYVKAFGTLGADAGRIEVPGGDLHQNGGLGGRLLELDEARAAVAGTGVPA